MSDERRIALFESDSFSRHLGMEVVSIEGCRAVLSMPFDERHRNSNGNTHGGAIFALADMTFAMAAHEHSEVMVSVQSSISFLSPGKVGPLTAVAEPVQLGRKLVVYEVKVTDGADTLVAIVSMTGYIKKLLPALQEQTHRQRERMLNFG